MTAQVKIISLLDGLDAEVLRNHQYYARLYGYSHQWVDVSSYAHSNLKIAYKYHYLLQQLSAMNEGDVLLMVDNDSAFFHPVDVASLMLGRDILIMHGPSDIGAPDIVMTNLIVLRNTAHNRGLLRDVLAIIATQEAVAEDDLLLSFDVLNSSYTSGDMRINIDWRITNWFFLKVFVVFLGQSGSLTDGRVHRQHVRHLTHDLNLQKMLFKQINGALIDDVPMMSTLKYPAISTDRVSHFNSKAKIAFVTLYTHHITSYARISENNIKRYCDRHGYAYHVYRDIPDGIETNIMGSWLKPYVLQNHFANHDWVIWVDADVLIKNQSQKIEEILLDKDILMAKDLCAWAINSGVLGFKNTAENARLLDLLWQRMLVVPDKSTVYANQGDQFHIMCALMEEGYMNERNVAECLTFNTPPAMANRNTFLVHYIGLGEPYRSMYMAHDDALSQNQQAWAQ